MSSGHLEGTPEVCNSGAHTKPYWAHGNALMWGSADEPRGRSPAWFWVRPTPHDLPALQHPLLAQQLPLSLPTSTKEHRRNTNAPSTSHKVPNSSVVLKMSL